MPKTVALTQLIRQNPFEPVTLPERMTWTSSSLKLFRSCKRKWFWKYIMRLRPRHREKGFIIGSAFHDTLGEWYRGKRAAIEPIAKRYAQAILEEIEEAGDWFDQNDLDDLTATANSFVGMMCGYEAQYSEDKLQWNIRRESIEHKFLVNMGDFDFRGKMDLIASHRNNGELGIFLTEHKTTIKIDEKYINRLPLDTQVRGYVYGSRHGQLKIKVDHVLYDVVRKTRLRRKANETLEQFDERVAQDYVDRPSFHFYREPLVFKEHHLAAFEHELFQTHKEYTDIIKQPGALDPRSWTPHDGSCYDFFRECEFIQQCGNGLTKGNAKHLRQSDVYHEELDNEDH